MSSGERIHETLVCQGGDRKRMFTPVLAQRLEIETDLPTDLLIPPQAPVTYFERFSAVVETTQELFNGQRLRSVGHDNSRRQDEEN